MARRDIPEINAGSMADIAFLLLIFFLVTTTMDKDQAYVRNIPKRVEVNTPPIDVEKRDILAIRANFNNELMVRDEKMSNPDDISERVVEFYTHNELTNDLSSNFPLYSRISLPEIQGNIDASLADAEATEATPGVTDDIIDFKYNILKEWEKKKRSLQLYGKKQLPEISPQAHIRIEVQKGTEYGLFSKIQSELEEAIYFLRDDAAKEIFGESYSKIKSRYSLDKKKDPKMDKEKLDLLKILYPDRFIEVTPTK
ncbi:MAG: hypothetical protein CL844_09485 [Crocinitomicaceae bacterium]|nr:hypothetical protein [Crocinitomicaceae bacterium]|tara:strand:- start:35743 stop:36507 length:765 start_codon:yes stop_codon:yes gene_type:complete